MKLAEIKPLFEQDEEKQAFNISPEDMEVVFKHVSKTDMTLDDVKSLAAELGESDEYTRNTGSALFLITRMHSLIHGIAPLGVTAATAETWFAPSGTIIRFIKGKGYDVEENVRKARAEVKTRKVKVKRPAARQLMFDYYKSIKPSLSPEQDSLLKRNNEEITQSIMDGLSPEEAFSRFIA